MMAYVDNFLTALSKVMRETRIPAKSGQPVKQQWKDPEFC